ncbi:MAG: hypothetical protein ACFFA0_00700 [Promethearchaeota archaeon]
MVSKEQKKIERVINFMKKGLTSLADDLEDTVKGINDFIKSLAKAQKDLKEVSVVEEVQTVSTSSKKIVAPTSGQAKTAAASTLFSLLSSGSPSPAPAAAPMASVPSAPAPPGGSPPSAPKPPGTGPPKKSGPPTAPPIAAPSGGPPKSPGLPPAPKLPPSGGGPPKAPSAGPPSAPSGPPVAPTFAKRPGAPPAAPGMPAAAPKAGGGLSSLRDEMLDELNRLKKIMRGE